MSGSGTGHDKDHMHCLLLLLLFILPVPCEDMWMDAAGQGNLYKVCDERKYEEACACVKPYGNTEIAEQTPPNTPLLNV